MLTSTFVDDEKKVPIAQQVGSENVDYHHQQQGVDSLQDEEEDKAAEKRVLRKIDLIVLPMVRTSYLLIDEPVPETPKFILQLTNPLFFNKSTDVSRLLHTIPRQTIPLLRFRLRSPHRSPSQLASIQLAHELLLSRPTRFRRPLYLSHESFPHCQIRGAHGHCMGWCMHVFSCAAEFCGICCCALSVGVCRGRGESGVYYYYVDLV